MANQQGADPEHQAEPGRLWSYGGKWVTRSSGGAL
jgi:hypothetical protein